MTNRAQRLGLEPGSVNPNEEAREGTSGQANWPLAEEIAHSIAISIKRIADHVAPLDSPNDGLSQFERNLSGILSDRFSDLVRQFLAER